jgi:hypothetical protein
MIYAKKEISVLKVLGINSIKLGIEFFNRPYKDGRTESVLHFMHQSIEKLLKAAILDRTGTIHTKETKFTYGFEKCLNLAYTELKIITKEMFSTLKLLDTHRNTSVHYYLEMSEDLLYIDAQSSVGIFNNILKTCFNENLADYFTTCVLPISNKPLKDLMLLIDSELSQVDELLKPNSRKETQAAARLRSIMAFSSVELSDGERISETELRKAITRRRQGDDWKVIFPWILQLRFETQHDGIPLYFRFDKNADISFRVAKDGEEADGLIIKQEINPLDKYNLSFRELVNKLGLTSPRVLTMMIELKIKEDKDCYKVLQWNKSEIKGYSIIAYNRIKTAIADGIDPNVIFEKHKHKLGYGKKNK